MLESTRKLRLFRKNVGRNMHNLRIERRLTLYQFAELLNMRPELIDRYELGMGQVSVEFISRAAAALEVEIERLVAKEKERQH